MYAHECLLCAQTCILLVLPSAFINPLLPDGKTEAQRGETGCSSVNILDPWASLPYEPLLTHLTDSEAPETSKFVSRSPPLSTVPAERQQHAPVPVLSTRGLKALSFCIHLEHSSVAPSIHAFTKQHGVPAPAREPYYSGPVCLSSGDP